MDRISAPPQNALLGRLADLLRLAETGAAGGPEFLPKGLDVMNLVRQLALPSAETVEKLSYGDPLFRMAPSGTGSRIPMTADKQYLADVAGMVPIAAPAARPSARGMQELVRQIQTEPPVGAVKLPPAPGLLEKSDIGFYSQLESAVQPLQNKGTGQQYLAQIQKSAGVKPEEIQWTGLDDFLKSKPSVTKQEVQDYLAANRVDVQEVQLSTPQVFDTPEEAINYLAVQFNLTPEQIVSGYRYENPYEYTFLADEIAADVNLTTNFSDYTLPGGKNYREILLTLPAKKPETTQADLDLLAKQNIFPVDTSTVQGGSKSTAFNTNAGLLDWSELGDELGVGGDIIAAAQRLAGGTDGRVYQSIHFDQPNILAHMRVNDRVVDGKKTLFIEEIQSDWHQAGRKKGYSDPQALQRISKEIKDRFGFKVDGSTSASKLARAGVSEDMIVRWEQAIEAGLSGVPDAPFKTSWHELSLKRAIQEAAEKGYDQIAFTTGKTQAERYNLSKQIDTLRAPYDNGEYVVSFIPRGGNEYEYFGRFTKDRLADAVGKDLAEKIIANKDVQTMTYKGDDLAIGGEGMKGFYDNILPKSLEKLGKKFDAKVGKTEMDGVEVWQMDITPQMRESVVTKGQPLFAIPAIGAGLLGAEMMQEEQIY